MKIAIIGLGNMGGAIYQQLKNIIPASRLLLCNRHRPKIRLPKNARFFTNANEAMREADMVILGIKPQSLAEFSKTITVDLSKKIVVSILAGVTLKKLQKLTGATKIIRAMPNLPVQVGLGVTGWVASQSVTREEKKFIKKILAALGIETELPNENMLTKLSVISGCGPAYFFYLTELLENKARDYGLSGEEARTIAAATFIGAAELLKRGSASAADWRAAVTSKKGVTEAVLKHLKKKKFDTIFYQALKQGIKRSGELAKLV